MKIHFNTFLIAVKLMSHKNKIKILFATKIKIVIKRIITINIFKSVYAFKKCSSGTLILFRFLVTIIARKRDEINFIKLIVSTVRKKNVEARRRFHSLTNNLLVITNFERRFTNDYITYRERNSKRVQCIALEIKTRPNERYRASLC
jgi:hypothetical protein